MNARIGYCSVACGADILFAEELLKLKRTTLHVVLPFALKDFYKTSVDFGRKRTVNRTVNTSVTVFSC